MSVSSIAPRKGRDAFRNAITEASEGSVAIQSRRSSMDRKSRYSRLPAAWEKRTITKISSRSASQQLISPSNSAESADTSLRCDMRKFGRPNLNWTAMVSPLFRCPFPLKRLRRKIVLRHHRRCVARSRHVWHTPHFARTSSIVSTTGTRSGRCAPEPDRRSMAACPRG